MAEQMDWMRDLEGIAPSDEGSAPQMATGAQTVAEAPQAPQGPVANRIGHSRADDWFYTRAAEEVKAFGQTVETAQEKYDHATPLAQDIFNALYKPEGAIDTQEVDEEFAKNAEAIDAMRKTSSFQEVKQQTTLDDFASAVSAATFTRHLVEELLKQEEEEPPTPPTPPSDEEGDDEGQGGDGAGQGGAGQGKGQGQGQGDKEGEGQEGQGDKAPTQAQADYAKAMQQYRREVAAQQHQQQTALRIAARKAADEAGKAVAAIQAAMDTFSGGENAIGQGWGLGGGAETSQGDIRQRAKLAAKIAANPRLQTIARNVGRLQFLAAAMQRNRAEHLPDEVVGIETGDDLTRVLASELAALADEDTELLFYSKYLERGLLQYERHGTEPQGKGPIIFCIDESGSMGGEPAAWAAAVGLCLLSIAAKQQRDFLWVHFGSEGQLRVDEFAKGHGTPERVMDTALHFFNGGTDFDTPLRAALDAIKGAKYAKADVVFATDGICAVSPIFLAEWHRIKAEKQFSCYGMLIGSAYGAQSMLEFCDSVANVLTPGKPESDAEVLQPAFSI